jgi:glucose-6-phosphate isomerase
MSFDDRILRDPHTGIVLDLSCAPAPMPDAPLIEALSAMEALERGARANTDEGRMVGHYWLRNPTGAPTEEIRSAIEVAQRQVRALQLGAHTDVLVIGIGGSALGPQLAHQCLGGTTPLHFLDNTDPVGIKHTLDRLNPTATLCLVVSRAGPQPKPGTRWPQRKPIGMPKRCRFPNTPSLLRAPVPC